MKYMQANLHAHTHTCAHTKRGKKHNHAIQWSWTSRCL